MPIDREGARRMSRIPEGSRRPARLRRTGCGLEHAVGDGRRGEGQGPFDEAGIGIMNEEVAATLLRFAARVAEVIKLFDA